MSGGPDAFELQQDGVRAEDTTMHWPSVMEWWKDMQQASIEQRAQSGKPKVNVNGANILTSIYVSVAKAPYVSLRSIGLDP